MKNRCTCSSDCGMHYVWLNTSYGQRYLTYEITSLSEASIVLSLPGSEKILEERTCADGSIRKICDTKELRNTVGEIGVDYYIMIACIASFLKKLNVELPEIKTEPSFIATCSEEEYEEMYLSLKKNAENLIKNMTKDQIYADCKIF